MEDSDMLAQAPIIFGQDLILMYGILNYIIRPDKYRAVDPPAQAPEEFLENDQHCVLPFLAALLDAANLPDFTATKSKLMATINDLPYDYDTDDHVHKDFPARARALAILRRFDGSVYVEKLNDSTINYEPMRAKLTKPFNGVPPHRMNREKQMFLEKWLKSALERRLIR